MNRRTFLSTAALSSAVRLPDKSLDAPGLSVSGFALDELTIADLQQGFRVRSLTSERVVELYLQRINDIDQGGAGLRAVLEVNPDALAIAKALDAEYKARGSRGRLHGIPVLLKDNIETADSMQTSAGSLALVGARPAQDAFVAARLRSAGAVVLGKTNLSEWANFRSTHSTSGWSGRGGQTRNPYALDRSPCGSSSGSAVAVSANLCSLAVGTETDGSVVCPSSMCGIVGIKPTLGLVSRSGIIPIAYSQDTAGAMARTVRDAAILLTAVSGMDPRDPETSQSRGHAGLDYTRFLNLDGLRGARIGVARQYFRIGPAVETVIANCIDLMRQAGAEIVDPADLPSYETWRETEQEVLLYEFKAGVNNYLAGRQLGVKSLADCIVFNRLHRDREMPYFEQELMEQAQAKGPLSEQTYQEALATNRRLTREEGIDSVLKEHRLDAIVGPTAGPAWPIDWVNGDRTDSGCASPPAVAGYPHITVPAGLTFGLPFGISFFGAAWSEPKLIALAYAFEQATKARRKPGFSPTVNFFG